MAAVEELSAKRQKTEEEPENEAEKEVSAKRQKTKDEPENDTEEDVSNGQEKEVEEESEVKTEEEPKEKPSGIPLICGSLNWDLMGREKSRVNSKPRKIEPAWTPQVMGALADVRVTDIIAGPCAAHSFFITDKGQLYGIGRNENGQLGLGNTERQDGAVEIPFFRGKTVIGAAVGRSHSVVLTEEEGAFAMGDNEMGQLGIGSNVGKGSSVTTPKAVQLQQKVKHAACGFDYSLFVTVKGFLYSAGSSESGQLGINDNGEYIEGRRLFYSTHASPTRVHSFFTRDPRTKEVTRVPNVLIRYVSAGQHHCLAVSDNDELYTWGFNGHGRLGHRTTENELIPMRVLHFRPGDKNSCVKIAKCSYGGCFAVNNLGNMYCWGQNQINRLECPYPIPVEDLYGWNVNDIGPGKNHHVIAADFSSIAMGKATNGELGLGPSRKSSSRPDKMQKVDGLKILQVGAGTAHTILLAADDDDEAKEILKKLEVNDD